MRSRCGRSPLAALNGSRSPPMKAVGRSGVRRMRGRIRWKLGAPSGSGPEPPGNEDASPEAWTATPSPSSPPSTDGDRLEGGGDANAGKAVGVVAPAEAAAAGATPPAGAGAPAAAPAP